MIHITALQLHSYSNEIPPRSLYEQLPYFHNNRRNADSLSRLSAVGCCFTTTTLIIEYLTARYDLPVRA